jgi:hypothetical protein
LVDLVGVPGATAAAVDVCAGAPGTAGVEACATAGAGVAGVAEDDAWAVDAGAGAGLGSFGYKSVNLI